jgi:exonuclease III
MRLITWNCCRGPYAKKVPLLDPFAPDIAVIQECARPKNAPSNCLWFGDNPNQGIAVQAVEPYSLHPLPTLAASPKYFVPVSVIGPVKFTLLAVWAMGGKPYPYVEAVVKAVEIYRDLLLGSPAVVIGDFNSNAIWDAHHTADLSHSGLVRLLDKLGLISAYHAKHNEEHGCESKPTFFFQWQQDRPFHIDYCFIPQAWASKITRVDVGSYEKWCQHSDHRPVFVEVCRYSFCRLRRFTWS